MCCAIVGRDAVFVAQAPWKDKSDSCTGRLRRFRQQGAGALGRGLLQAQQSVVTAEQAVSPFAADTRGARLDAGQGQLIGDPEAPWQGCATL
jgi:hypothetical protein